MQLENGVIGPDSVPLTLSPSSILEEWEPHYHYEPLYAGRSHPPVDSVPQPSTGAHLQPPAHSQGGSSGLWKETQASNTNASVKGQTEHLKHEVQRWFLLAL